MITACLLVLGLLAPVSDGPEQLLEASLSTPGKGAPDALYVSFVERDGSLDTLLELLSSEIDARTDRTAEAHRLRAWLRWRDGDLDGATEDFGLLAAADPQGEAALSHARLLDASGEVEEALEAYRGLIPALEGGPDESWLRVRMALIEMEIGGDEARDALAEYAQRPSVDPELRNRASIVLALLSRPSDAVDLYLVPEDPKGAFRGELRLAEWGLRAERLDVAQEAAWRAVRTATLSRDRRYALSVLEEAHRADGSEAALLERFASTGELSSEERDAWIGLLRATDRYDEAIELFSASGAESFEPEQRLELLEMYRQAGREDETVAAYLELIDQEPEQLTWREGLARLHLEAGRVDEAVAVWRTWLDSETSGAALMNGAHLLAGLGRDDLARESAERAFDAGHGVEAVQLFLYELERNRGRLDEAADALVDLGAAVGPDSPVRYQLSEAWEQLGDPERAASTLEAVVEVRGLEEAGEDVAMRLAWLYSELGEEERALEAWTDLAERVKSVPRLRYVEDRLMTVAARLGQLADIAVDLEQQLIAGEADEREANLLVRLYTSVGDAVSAAEVIDEFLSRSGKSEVEALAEKARVYLTCTDYYHYERTVERLMEVDPDGRSDYLQQLAMSQLERGRPKEARNTLRELATLENDAVGAEFEAGVLTLAGLREEATLAYRRGLAVHPERIDSYLLLANLYRELGRADQAVGMFQYLAETADQDDLFTVSIDGLLNQLVDAPPRPKMLAWARRQVLERLARNADRSYLYQLLADLAEEDDDQAGQLDALEYSLSIAGTRRSSVLRELMDLAGAEEDVFGGSSGGSKDRQLAYGRRLIGLGELVPPDVFLDLGEVFLEEEDVSSAVKTFAMARDLPDPIAFRRETAALLETSGFEAEALASYSGVLATRPSDAGLLVKVGEMEEMLGSDERALPLYAKALELMLARKPLLETVAPEEEDEDDDPFAFFSFSRNVDAFDRFHDRALTGLLATLEDGPEADESLALWERSVRDEWSAAERTAVDGSTDFEGDLERLEQMPRAGARLLLFRRMALSLGRVDAADALDRDLLERFPEDVAFQDDLLDDRVRRGLLRSARELIESAEIDPARQGELLARAGRASVDEAAPQLPLVEGLRRLLPMAAEGRRAELALLLRRIDLADLENDQLASLQALFTAAQWSGDEDAALFVAREWVRLMLAAEQPSYYAEQAVTGCGAALSEEGRRSLYQYFVSLVLADTELGSQYVTTVAELSRDVGGGLVDSEQILELLEGYGEGYVFGLGPVLELLEEDERGGAMRSLWPKIEASQRADVLLSLVTEMSDGVGEDLGKFITEALGEALPEAQDFIRYSVADLGDTKSNHEVILSLLPALEIRFPGSPMIDAIGCLAKHSLEREEEALAEAPRLWAELVASGDQDYPVTRLGNLLLERFLPDAADAFLEAAERQSAEGESVALTLAHIRLANRCERPELGLELALAGREAHEDDVDVLTTLQRQFVIQGRWEDAAGVYVDLLSDEELGDEGQRKNWARALIDGWKSRQHWPRALEAEALVEEVGIDLEESSGIPGLPPGLILAPGTTVFINGVAYTAGSTTAKGLPKTVEDVRDAIEEDRMEDARATLRRLWRSFTVGEAAPRFGFGRSNSPLANLTWPDSDDDENDEADEETDEDLGGFVGFSVPEPEEDDDAEEELPNAYERLAEHEVLRDEIRRFLRTRTSRELNALQSLYEGLVASEVGRSDAATLLASLLDEARAGTGGRSTSVMLLALLDEHPELLSPDIDEHLSALVHGVDPKDSVQVQRLARVWARAGRAENALRLYRWCATRLSGGRVSFFGADDGSSYVSADQLLEEAKERLEGEDRIRLVEDVLRSLDTKGSPWQRQNFEVKAMSTWREMLGHAAALERTRDVAEGVLDLGQGLRRGPALEAAILFAHAGEWDNAVRALEIGLAELPPEDVTQPVERWYRSEPERPGYLRTSLLPDLFPDDAETWADPVGWFERASEALFTWVAEDRLPADRILVGQAVLAARLARHGELETANQIVDRSLELIEDRSSVALWFADVLRELDRPEQALELELGLLRDSKLPSPRLPIVMERVREASGPRAVLDLAEEWLDTTRKLEALEVVAASAGELEDAEEQERWTTLLAESRAAKTELESEDE